MWKLFHFVVLCGFFTISFADLLGDSTDSIFGSIDKDVLPMAFLDLNGDQRTDIAVITNRSHTLTFLVARADSVIPTGPAFILTQIECSVPDKSQSIVSVIPGDFDGDGYNDIAVVTDKKGHLETFILWTTQVGEGLLPILDCSGFQSGILMRLQPIMLDGDGDNIADLFGVNESKKFGFWLFSQNRTESPSFLPIKKEGEEEGVSFEGSSGQLHSNAFVDLNEDGNADLFITRENRFELWQNVGNQKSDSGHPNFVHHKNVHISGCDEDCVIGQVAFDDFNKDGRIDVLFPVCKDGVSCSMNMFFFATVHEMFSNSTENFRFEIIPLKADGWTFDMRKSDFDSYSNPYLALSARTGDLNLDGYPDILLRMKTLPSQPKEERTIQFFVNVPSSSHDYSSTDGRAFLLASDLLEDSNSLVVGAFYDAYDDGRLDVMAVQDYNNGSFRLKSFSNVSLAGVGSFFMKLTVLTGREVRSSSGEAIVPYGSNSNGQTVCYSSENKPNLTPPMRYDTCVPQMPQTAFAALQTTEAHFGLVSSINSVEAVNIKISNSSSSPSERTWYKVILNTKLFVVPFPTDEPLSWSMKISIPLGSVVRAIIGWVGLMVVLGLIIAVLHFQEQRLERKERLQERTQFHFSAM